ncbi:hypothetical protein Tco_0138439 [Tanacetum coccineum]
MLHHKTQTEITMGQRKSLSLEPDKNKQCDQAICLMYMKRISREMYGAYAKSYECAVMGIHGLEPIMQPQVFDGLSILLSELDVLLSFADMTASSPTPYTRPQITSSVIVLNCIYVMQRWLRAGGFLLGITLSVLTTTELATSMAA